MDDLSLSLCLSNKPTLKRERVRENMEGEQRGCTKAPGTSSVRVHVLGKKATKRRKPEEWMLLEAKKGS